MKVTRSEWMTAAIIALGFAGVGCAGLALFPSHHSREPGRIEIAYYVTGTRDTVDADDWEIESEMITFYRRGVAVTSINLVMVGRVRRLP